MIFLILLIVVALNVAWILLMYKFLGKQTPGKQKFIFIVVGIAVMYLITLLVYWIATHDLSEVYTTGMTKDLVVFMFVPINGLIVLPLLAASYDSYRQKKIEKNTFIKRGLLLLIPLIIVLVCEAFLLDNVQILVTNALDETVATEYEEQIEENTEETEEGENETSEENTDEVTNEDVNNEEDNADSEEETSEDETEVEEEENIVVEE